MKRFFIKITIIIALVIAIMSTIFIGVVEVMGSGFADTYQSVIVRKYDKLITTNTPKIIIIGGSSAAFGINEEIISKSTGYDVVNLGLHAGFGSNFPTQLSKANINNGDIVILAYEYGWIEEGAFDKLGVDLVMSGIDNHISLYKHIRFQNYDDIIDYIFKYANKKAERISTDEIQKDVYSSSSFNDKGQMIYDRQKSIITEKYDEKKYGNINIDDFKIYDDTKKFLINYRKFVEKKGAKIFFTAAPIMKSSNRSDSYKYSNMVNTVEKELNIKYISNPTEYFFDTKYMYDTIYHLNSEGEKIRSNKLAEDINNALIDYK